MEENLLQKGGIVLHNGVLGQVADLDIGIAGQLALVRRQLAGEDFQKGGFSCAVDAKDAHLVPFVEIEIDLRKQLPAAEIDRQIFCG